MTRVHTLRAGIDIGGSSTKGVALSSTGDVLAQRSVPTVVGGQAALLDSVRAALDALADAVDGPVAFTGLGVGVPGRVGDDGHVSHAVNLGVEADGLDLARLLTEACRLPTRVANDANAAALGALHLVAPEGTTSLACLSIGTGAAAGIVRNGKLWAGRAGLAGEIGHVTVQPGGELCGCGRRGCLETVLAGSVLTRQHGGAEALFAAAHGGDRTAEAALECWIGHLAWAVELLILTLDVDVVVITGGVAEVGTPLLTRLRARLDCDSPPFLREGASPSERVRLAAPRLMPGAVGAALLAPVVPTVKDVPWS